jgi:flagellar hook-associated protein 1
MSLTSSLSSAKSSLYTTGEQSSVTSRNIANAGVPLYSRKSVEVVTVPGSGVKTSQVVRAEEPALFRTMIGANSNASAQKVVVDALDILNTTINDVEQDASPAGLMSKFSDALQSYSSQPQSQLAAEAAVRAARNLSNGLNAASDVVQKARQDADASIASSVDRINTLLSRFDTVNKQIIDGTQSGADVTDYLDSRDQIVNDLSTELGVRTQMRGDNDMALYTDSGVVLYDRGARSVTFAATPTPAPGQPGNAVIIDGVPVTGSGAMMPLQSGRLVGLVQVRDDITVTYQRQLDEMGRALINSFAESDQSGGGGPDVPGLFVYSGGDLPTGLTDGLALSISVNRNVDPDVGGLATRLRDGGISDPNNADYVYNTEGGASYSDRLNQLSAKLGDKQNFDAAAGVEPDATLIDYSSTSVAWLQERRKIAGDSYDYLNTLYSRATESHSKLTGVNLDEEMANMLELERSYQSSSKIINVVDEMYNALLAAIG